jgi:hypothetical protein
MGGCEDELRQGMHAIATQEEDDQKNSYDECWTEICKNAQSQICNGDGGHGDGGEVAFSASPFAPLLSSSNGSGRTIDAIYSSDQRRQESPFMECTNSPPVAHEVHLACE